MADRPGAGPSPRRTPSVGRTEGVGRCEGAPGRVRAGDPRPNRGDRWRLTRHSASAARRMTASPPWPRLRRHSHGARRRVPGYRAWRRDRPTRKELHIAGAAIHRRPQSRGGRPRSRRPNRRPGRARRRRFRGPGQGHSRVLFRRPVVSAPLQARPRAHMCDGLMTAPPDTCAGASRPQVGSASPTR
jgi:hypothetical protein